MSDLYYIIDTGPDGAHLTVMTKAKLEKALADGDWGDDVMSKRLLAGNQTDVDLTAIEGMLIIKGQSIVPRPKQVVETWEVP